MRWVHDLIMRSLPAILAGQKALNFSAASRDAFAASVNRLIVGPIAAEVGRSVAAGEQGCRGACSPVLYSSDGRVNVL